MLHTYFNSDYVYQAKASLMKSLVIEVERKLSLFRSDCVRLKKIVQILYILAGHSSSTLYICLSTKQMSTIETKFYDRSISLLLNNLHNELFSWGVKTVCHASEKFKGLRGMLKKFKRLLTEVFILITSLYTLIVLWKMRHFCLLLLDSFGRRCILYIILYSLYFSWPPPLRLSLVHCSWSVRTIVV